MEEGTAFEVDRAQTVPLAPARAEPSTWGRARPLPLLITLLVGAVLWVLPAPSGIAAEAWHLLAIFVATIIGIIVRALPMGAVALIGLTMAVVSGTLTLGEALSGFGHSVVWLVVAAFFVAHGFIETGLGLRIAYGFMALLGRRSIGLAFGLIATDLVLAPAIPSNTARAGGVVFPILRSLGKTFRSEANDGTASRLSAFLAVTAYQGTVITSAMFMTAMAANPLAARFAGELGIALSWRTWAAAAVVPGFASLLLVPLLIYYVYPPELRQTPAARRIATKALAAMGPMKASEWTLSIVFVGLLVLWIFGSAAGIDTTTAALLGVAVLLVTGVLSWRGLCAETDIWNTLVWFATLVMMANFLGERGLVGWFSEAVAGLMTGLDWVFAFLALALVYFFSHYFFASSTAHVSAMYLPFLAAAVALDTPPLLAALLLAFFSSLFAGLTHYGTAPGPIIFGAGYVSLGAWWRIGALVAIVNIVIWLGVGGLWWKALGYW